MNESISALELENDAVGPAVGQGLRALFLHDSHLIQADASERAITHQLAFRLQGHFSDYHVDCEYNRAGYGQKKVDLFKYDEKRPSKLDARVFPDIIVHLRNTCDNLLAIEVKKTTNSEPDDLDLEKLGRLRKQLGYRHALFLKIRVGDTDEAGLAGFQWV